MPAPHQHPQESALEERSFADAYRRRPARAPHGLVPGRRVWVTLGWAAAATAAMSVSASLVTAANGGADSQENRASIPVAGIQPHSPQPDASKTPAPSPSPSDSGVEAGKEKQEHKEGPAARVQEDPVVVRPAAPVTVTAEPDDGSAADRTGKGGASSGSNSSTSSGSTGSSGSTNSSGTGSGTSPQGQDFSRPLGRISGHYDPFVGRCIQLVGTGLQLFTCDGGADQNWKFNANGTLGKSGLCLSLAGRSTRDGTRVVMASCDSSKVMQWRFSPGWDIVNVAADKCLDVANANPANGTPLQIAFCSGNAAQKWYVP
ncbi:RICIN domain-containing protein [Streptomyces antibioticus]|uniref:RICIN domain-containing protein n=1 Tax=Streptomyces antibioticus TaxID=1890 RepID=UPI0033D7456A